MYITVGICHDFIMVKFWAVTNIHKDTTWVEVPIRQVSSRCLTSIWLKFVIIHWFCWETLNFCQSENGFKNIQISHFSVVNVVHKDVNSMTGAASCSAPGKQTLHLFTNGKDMWDFSFLEIYKKKIFLI